MKNVLLKFAGLFVERVPVDERGNPLPPAPPGPRGVGNAPASGHQPPAPQPQQPSAAPVPQYPAAAPAQHGQGAGAPAHGEPMVGQQPGPAHAVPGAPAPQVAGSPLAVALRAWVPEEYAGHLAPFGIHVIAAGGSVTSEQAQGWGADVLVVSAECLGQDLHLLQQPRLPTVFITPQPVMIPDVPGVLQVQEPLRASDVANAARTAAAAFAAARQ